MALSEAQKRANAKYNRNNYKNIGVKMKIIDAEILDKYINDNNISSRNNYIINSIKYCINNNINVFDDQENKSKQDKNNKNNNSDDTQE